MPIIIIIPNEINPSPSKGFISRKNIYIINPGTKYMEYLIKYFVILSSFLTAIV